MKEFIISNKDDWEGLLNLVRPVIGVKSFKVELSTDFKRTKPQNKLLHAVFKECTEKTGVKDAAWWKIELKNKLGLKEVDFDIEDRPTVIVLSTTEYSASQVSVFCEKVVAHMKTEFDVNINLGDD